jgi:predicted DNA-binding transcriptional regulator AlpA
MNEFTCDAASRAISISPQVNAPGDNDGEATGDIPRASAEDRSAKDRGGQGAVGSITNNDPSLALSTKVEGPSGGEAPRVLGPTLHLTRPAGVERQSYSHGRSKAVVVEKVKRRFLAPSEWPGFPARSSATDGRGEELQKTLSEPAAKSPRSGGATAAAPNLPPSASATSCVSDERQWRPTRVGDMYDPTKSSQKDSGDTEPSRTRSGSHMAQPVSAIAFPGDAHGLLREKEVAGILGLSSATLRNWRTRGDGPPFVRLSGRAIRYEPVALREWVTQRRRRSTSDEKNNNG